MADIALRVLFEEEVERCTGPASEVIVGGGVAAVTAGTEAR